jgi:hypothetical protein
VALFISLEEPMQNLKITAYSKAIDTENIVKVLRRDLAMN